MKIEVFTREEFASNEEKGLLRKLSHFSPRARAARESKLYIIDGSYGKKDFEKMAGNVLSDFIAEDFTAGKPRKLDGFVRVEMLFKPGITDVLAQSAAEALFLGGFSKPAKIVTGRVFYIKGLSPLEAQSAVMACFGNDLIHSVRAD